MDKLFGGILKVVLVVLFFAGVAFLGTVIRSHILLPFIVLLLTLVLAFLFYKAPDFIGEDHLHTVFKYIYYFSIGVAFTCFIFSSKSEAYIEKYLFGGKVKQTDVETEGPNGEPGSATVYYLDNTSPMQDHFVSLSYWLFVVGVPYLVWRMWQKTDSLRQLGRRPHKK